MSTPAVTPSDSALTIEPTPLGESEREFAAYQREQNAKELARRKGEAPSSGTSAPPKQETPAAGETTQSPEAEAVTVDDPASSESEIAAASETASTQEKPIKEKPPGDNRWAKLSRENKDLRDRLERLEREKSQPRDDKQTPQPATQTPKVSAKPKFEDVDDKGQPKFKTYAEYEDARDTWLREDVKREITEGQTKSQKEQEQKRVQETIGREWASRVQKAQTKYSDYDAVALNPDLPIKQGSAVDAFILDSPQGVDVLYHLGKNPTELDRINKLNPVAQIRELTKLEQKYSVTPAKRITSAPPPPRTVNATGTTGADEVETALKGDDFASYRDRANARDVAARRGR